MKAWKELAMAAVIAWLVPWFMVQAVLTARMEKTPTMDTPTEPAAEETEAQSQELIRVKLGAEHTGIPLDDYLTGVILAEIPGSFHMEAKMAQAVVARTYALRTVQTTRKHPGAVCSDSNCCQGYLSVQDYLASGGSMEIVTAAQHAVHETEGMVLTYEGELIDATYFSCSGGQTEDAVAVWGSDVPYLQSVPSPGEQIAAHYTDTVTFTPTQFCNALGTKLQGSPTGWFGSTVYTEGGGVASMVIGGRRYTGTQLRSLLGLRSTAFTVKIEEGNIRITTKGFGHRVGMSQYGAQAMALAGKNYEQILRHYYQGTVLERRMINSELPEQR